MTRTDIINHFIDARKYRDYLEIGIYTGENFRNVRAINKQGVDPTPLYEADPTKNESISKVTSDMFFSHQADLTFPEYFDIIFIDGLHTEEQVTKDIGNSLSVLNSGGVVILHDCNPPTELHARPEYTGEIQEWNGTVYKAWLKFRIENSKNKLKYQTYTINTDWGVGVIDTVHTPPYSAIFNMPRTWEEFDKYRYEWLGLISPEEFLNKLDESKLTHSSLQ